MIFHYNVNYDNCLLRGVDDPTSPRQWNLREEILRYVSINKIMLDIGCGTSFKLIPIAPCLKKIIALDVKFEMTLLSKKKLLSEKINNVDWVTGDGEHLPFCGRSFDIITCMLSRWRISEISRVLKKDGVAVIENIGCEDKIEFKQLFGKDSEGWRGQLIDYKKNDYIEYFYTAFGKFFKNVTIKNGFWYTYYTPTGLLELLKNTPTIRNFNIENDGHVLEKAMKLFSTPMGIRLQQNRVLIHAKNY